MNSTTVKEKTQEKVSVLAQVVVEFKVDKDNFLNDQHQAIHRALSEGDATIKWDYNHFTLGDLNKTSLGVSEKFPFKMPSGDMKLPYHIYERIEERIEDWQEAIDFKECSKENTEHLEFALQEFKELQSLFREAPKYSKTQIEAALQKLRAIKL